MFFFFQAEDGIRDYKVTGVQTCALPISLDGMGDGAVHDLPFERMEPELERRHDPEVRAGATQAPEELRVLVLACANDPAVGGRELDGQQIVDRQTELPLQPAHAPSEREAGDTRVRDDAD